MAPNAMARPTFPHVERERERRRKKKKMSQHLLSIDIYFSEGSFVLWPRKQRLPGSFISV